MNLLQLCQRLILEAGISGSISTAVSQTGEMLRVVSWVQQAWTDLQTRHDDWTWRRSSRLLGAGVSFATTAGTAFYPLGTGAGTVGVAATDFGKWVKDSFRNHVTSQGVSSEIRMGPVSFEEWREAYMYGAQQSVQTRPVVFAIGPQQQICLGPPPNGQYTITGDFMMAPTQMSADADEPTNLPADFHMAIVWQGLIYYASYEAAPEVLDRGEREFGKLIKRLDLLRGQEITLAGALA